MTDQWHGVSLHGVAQRYGTPCFVYSASHCRERYAELSSALTDVSHRICYAVKANSNLALLRLFADLGAGFDIVSGGELVRVLEAGGQASQVVFSGVGKRIDEIDFALKNGVGCFNVESEPELERIEARAALLARRAPISLRVNPDVDAQTHPYISTGLRENKFGVPVEQARVLYRRAAASPHLAVLGIDCHIGSQIVNAAPFEDALAALLALVDELAADGIELAHLDLGGGLGIDYGEPGQNAGLDAARYGASISRAMAGRELTFVMEPGRFLVANAGLLLTRVEYLKPAVAEGYRDFAIVDAAMNDLLRPALYQAWHDVRLVGDAPPEASTRRWDLVGPVCETGDFLARERSLALHPGALLAVHGAGAYGMAQASNYNSRPRAAEVLVDADGAHLIGERETLNDLLQRERVGLRSAAAGQPA